MTLTPAFVSNVDRNLYFCGGVRSDNFTRVNLFCIRCGASLRPEDVDASAGTARCRDCGEVFSFAHRGVAVPGVNAAPTIATNEVLTRPPQMVVDHQGRRLLIRWRWFTPTYLMLALFCVAWDSFLIFWYSIAFRSHNTPWLMVVFPVVHVAAGVGLTYSTLCGFINRTTLEITPDGLTIRHGPLPWAGNRQLAATQIRQPFCDVSMSRNAVNANRNTASPTYQVSAVLNDGSKVTLVGGLRELADARYLERLIELAMNIAPQPVAGECRA